MSSSSFQSARSYSCHCWCGIPVARKQSWTSRNPGRRFACCKVYNRETGEHGCNFWEWIDAEMVEWQRVVINQLVLDKKLLEKEKELLKGEVYNLEDQKYNLLRDLDGVRRRCNQLSMEKKSKDKKKQGSVALMIYGLVVLLVIVAICVILVW